MGLIMERRTSIITAKDLILVTGSSGFIGTRVTAELLRLGFTHLRCFVRPSSNLTRLHQVLAAYPAASVEVLRGNLLSRDDCLQAAQNAAIVLHLAAGIEKTFPGSFMNSVVTTRNLLEALAAGTALKRFVNISSFAVYSNRTLQRGGLLDETCPLEPDPVRRHEPYVFAKLRQDELVLEYARRHAMPVVIMRPGAVYGPGKGDITARVGIDTFGFFLHLGGSNRIPLTYVDNCAAAIALAGITPGIDGQVFNIVDDELPTSRELLASYKRNRGGFNSLFLPYGLFYGACWLWEKYAQWSQGQLPPVFNPLRCAAYWKGNRYSNAKLKKLLGWKPAINLADGLNRLFEKAAAQGGAQ